MAAVFEEDPDHELTAAEAAAWVRENKKNGVICPVCGQLAKEYDRSLPSACARVMVRLHRLSNYGKDRETYFFLPSVLDTMLRTAYQGGYATLGHHWRLMEQQPGVRDDGSNRVGWWRLTDLGHRYVQGVVTVPRYAEIYDNNCSKLYGPSWSIHQALTSKFNYRELMGYDDEDR